MLRVLIRTTSVVILTSIDNICFYREITEIILQLSSNILLISSGDVRIFQTFLVYIGLDVSYTYLERKILDGFNLFLPRRENVG